MSIMSPLSRPANSIWFRMESNEPAPVSKVPLISTLTSSVFTNMETATSTSADTALVSPTSNRSSMISIITVSPTGSLSATQSSQAPSLPTNATSFGTAPQAANDGRIPIIVIILVSIISIILLISITFLVRARSRKACANKLQIDLEGRLEVIEARAIMPRDETLKRAYSPSLLYGDDEKEPPVKELRILTKIHSNQNDLIPHPLFHPELKRSRTLSYDRTHPRTPRTPSTPYVMASRSPRIDLPASPLSPRLSKESRALSQYTTMQTRRPKTPSIQIPLPERRSEPAAIYQNRLVKSVWSSPTVSMAPSSPSIYSESPVKTRPQSLSPMPSRDMEFLPQSSRSVILHQENCPLAAIEMAEQLRKPLDQFIHSTQIISVNSNMRRASTPLSPEEPRSYSPVHSFLGIPEPEPAFCPPSRRPSLAELNAMSDNMSLECPLGLERVDDEVKVERWLEGSSRTVSAFGSLMDAGDGFQRGRQRSVVERGREGRRESVKLSPIRDMRPSWARRGSAQKSEAGIYGESGN